ncbi:hypothetical protein B4098_1232 [Heyndrickxia coagulans]|uniref:Uncharacterized protein n=1 Tax=Heyndrickxia coagulans TaxID=1398 RepID=A0A150KEW4_HEYCO|nr:hypothetical protein B4098_1232 [Heyndrickxia coagulans]KYC69437.1 hypothetical protein B4099_1363 [Heyndrickxia coagulans]
MASFSRKMLLLMPSMPLENKGTEQVAHFVPPSFAPGKLARA